MATLLYSNISLETQVSDPKHLINSLVAQDLIAQVTKRPVRTVSQVNQAGTYTSTTGVLTLTANGILVIDSVTMAADNRVLLAGQTTQTENGIYTVTDPGTASTAAILTRATDANKSELVYAGMHVIVNEGTLAHDTDWRLTTDEPITLDTTNLVFEQIGGGAAASVVKYTGVYTSVATGALTVQHDINNAFPSVSVYSTSTKTQILCDIASVDNNSLTLTFGAAPGDITVTVIG